MFPYVNGNNIHDIRAQQLFTRIDEQLEQWNKMYGAATRPARPGTSVPPVKENWASSEAESPPHGANVHGGFSPAVPATTTTTTTTTRAASTFPNSEDKLHSSVFLTRISVLEEQLRAAEEDRLNLWRLFSAMDRRLLEVSTAQEALQKEWITFREQLLPSSRMNDADVKIIATAASTRESEKHRATHFLQRQHSGDINSSNDNNARRQSGSSTSSFSGPPTSTSTEMARTQGGSSVVGFRMSGAASSGMPLMFASSLNMEPGQQRRMVLEQLAHRLSIPIEFQGVGHTSQIEEGRE